VSTSPTAYELVLAPPARRAIADRLPESVATAVIEFITTALIADPHRVGKPLRDDLAGIWSARRGTYRVLYRIIEEPREVVVLHVEHRRDAYRPR
jgi:mRNA interferase RelE/StbE